MKCHIRKTLDHFTSFPLSGVVSPCPGAAVLATGRGASPMWLHVATAGRGWSGVFCSGRQLVQSLVAAPGDLEESRSFSEAPGAAEAPGASFTWGEDGGGLGAQRPRRTITQYPATDNGNRDPQDPGMCPGAPGVEHAPSRAFIAEKFFFC